MIFFLEQWRRQINRFEIAEANPDYRYIIQMGINPYTGEGSYKTHLYRVTDGSNNYVEMELPGQISEEEYTLASDIVVDPLNPERIWISFTGFDGDYRVYYCENYIDVDSWENADPNNSLPRLPVNAITYQKGSNDILYIATDAGIYVKNGPNADWEKYGACPNVMVQDLKINYCNNKLRIATFGRGVWQADIIETDNDFPEIAFGPGETNLWDSEVDRGLRNNLRIKSGHVFTIQGKISMPVNGKITIEPGAKLIIDGGELRNNCDNLWQGITVLGNQNLSQTEANQGVVELINGARIENAVTGIYASNGVDDSENGGIIKVEDAVFIDNAWAIRIPSYRTSENQSYIKNSIFKTTAAYFDTGTNISPHAFITLYDVGNIDIEGNTFKNENEFGFNNLPIFKQGTGVQATDADFSIVPSSSAPNHFINLYKGVDVQSTSYASSNTISENTFSGNVTGVYLNNANSTTVTSNLIDLYSEFDFGGRYKPTGLYVIGSQDLHIENNQIEDSSTDKPNVTVGMFVRDCIGTSDEIYRNGFADIDTGVFSQGINGGTSFLSGLKIICNVFTDVAHDIYVAPLSQIGIIQGSKYETAGNQFIPECSGTYDEFDNNGGQITYYYQNSPEYIPDCNYNVNLFLGDQNNDCSSHLNEIGGFDAALAILNSDINGTESALLALTDGGDTEALNETVDEAENNEALKLRNELLSKSPTLSDTVMVNTTTIEDVLPSLMVKQVLSANPKAAKSDKVQTALDNRVNQLPSYMRAEINLGKDSLSYKEALESQLSLAMHQREVLINRKMSQLKKEASTESLDSLETLLVAEANTKLNRTYQLVNHYLSQGNLQEAQNVFTAIPTNFELTGSQQTAYDKLEQLYNIRFALENANQTWFEMDSSQKSVVQSLAIDSTSTAGMQSRAVLALVDHIDYGCYIPDIVVTPKSGYAYEVIEEAFEVYPKQANDYFIVEYALGENEILKETSISVFDDKGMKVKDFVLKTRANQFLTECASWKEGVYWCRKLVDKKVVTEQKVIIKRGEITPDEVNSVYGANSLVLFPNPTNGYLFVSYKNTTNAIARITDAKGALVGNYKLKGNLTNIATHNWQQGVYIISILRNNKVLDSAKIVVE